MSCKDKPRPSIGLRPLITYCVACALACSPVGPLARAQTAQAAEHLETPIPARVDPANTGRRIPLSFERNQGQTDGRVAFLARGQGSTLFLTSTEAVLVVTPRTVLRMTLVGANSQPRMAGEVELPGKVHYFRGNDPSKWQTNLPTYAKVRTQEVYPGIDIVYYGSNGHLEYDFLVAPGADPNSIALRFSGADALVVDQHGDVVLHTAGGVVRHHQPQIYQEVDGVRRAVTGGYHLDGAQQVRFEVGPYDRTKPLIIDPGITYSTYLGGNSGPGGLSGSEFGHGIAVDDAGNAYVTGQTTSPNFPVTNGAFDTAVNEGADVFVAKLNATGSALLYSTYLGGNQDDAGLGIAVDDEGNAYVVGQTASANFPTVNAFQTTHAGGTDAFVAKLDPTGSALLYATFLGGASNDVGLSIAVDAEGFAYVTGQTASAGFPTVNPFQVFAGASDAFVAKFQPTASGAGSLLWSTFLGGTGADIGRGIAVVLFGQSRPEVYLTGQTTSVDFPTKEPIQSRFGGLVDAFAAAISETSSGHPRLDGSTFLGGSLIDIGSAIAVKGSVAYITGTTSSFDFPLRRAFDAVFKGQQAFVASVDLLSPSSLLWSSYLGGRGTESGLGIAVDAADNVWVTGVTTSPDFPTLCALQSTLRGNSDAFVARIGDSTLVPQLLESTYLGGDGDDQGAGIALDASGRVYLTGRTTSINFPTASATPGTVPVQPSPGGGDADAFVTKLQPCQRPPSTPPTPGLTGFWRGLAQTCEGAEVPADDRVCVLEGTFVVQNPGTATAARSVLRFALSADALFDGAQDLVLKELAVGPVPAGETRTKRLHTRLPRGKSATGHYVIAVVDANNDVPEANEDNNAIAFGPLP